MSKCKTIILVHPFTSIASIYDRIKPTGYKTLVTTFDKVWIKDGMPVN